jgi:hypothetical protein
MKCSKQLSVTMTWGEHRLLSGFLDSNEGKIWLKIEHSGCPSTGCTDENVDEVCKTVNKEQ